MAIERPWPPLAIITGVTNPDLVLLTYHRILLILIPLNYGGRNLGMKNK
jgi:hypothetical protein